MEGEMSFPVFVDPLLDRADKIVEILDVKNQPQFADDDSQAVLAMVVRGLLKPFLPDLQVVGKEDNVVHLGER